MDSTRQRSAKQQIPSDSPELAWQQAIKRDLPIRGEAKLAALFLAAKAGWQPGTVVTTSVEIAWDQGGSDRAARRWLEALVEVGFVTLVDRDRNGKLHLYVEDPVTLSRGRLVEPNDQRELPFMAGGCGGSGTETAAAFGTVRGTKTAACTPPAIYPRAPAVESSRVESRRDDSSTTTDLERETTASQPVTEAEHAEAARSLAEVEECWRRAGLRLATDRAQREEDRALIRRAHVLMRRGLLPEAAYADATHGPVAIRQQGRAVKKPAAIVTRRLFQEPGFRDAIGLVREGPELRPDAGGAAGSLSHQHPPAKPMTSEDLHEAFAAAGLRIPNRAPNGELDPPTRAPPPHPSEN